MQLGDSAPAWGLLAALPVQRFRNRLTHPHLHPAPPSPWAWLGRPPSHLRLHLCLWGRCLGPSQLRHFWKLHRLPGHRWPAAPPVEVWGPGFVFLGHTQGTPVWQVHGARGLGVGAGPWEAAGLLGVSRVRPCQPGCPRQRRAQRAGCRRPPRGCSISGDQAESRQKPSSVCCETSESEAQRQRLAPSPTASQKSLLGQAGGAHGARVGPAAGFLSTFTHRVPPWWHTAP